MNTNQSIINKLSDNVFISTSIIFNLLVSALYLAVKFDREILVEALGVTIVLLVFPFIYTFINSLKQKVQKKIIVSHIFILFYFLVEVLFDYVLKIPFREILALHITYIIFFYAASFSMMGVSIRINKRWGIVVTATFLILIGCLIYLYNY